MMTFQPQSRNTGVVHPHILYVFCIKILFSISAVRQNRQRSRSCYKTEHYTLAPLFRRRATTLPSRVGGLHIIKHTLIVCNLPLT